ncbi:hypothetical protein HK102_006136, partial [Quaeritorhiza haematococci]
TNLQTPSSVALQKTAKIYSSLGYLTFPVKIWGDRWEEQADGSRKLKKECLFPGTWNALSLEQMNALPFYDRNAIAILTGHRSGITVVEVDKLDTWVELLQLAGETEPETVRARSQSGGVHLYFKYVPDLPTDSNVFPSIDIRNDKNGCIFAPPSTFVYEGKKRKYTWYPGFSLIENRDKLMEIPEWLFCSIRKSLADKKKSKKRLAANRVSVEEYDLFGDEDQVRSSALPKRKKKHHHHQQHAVDLFQHQGHPEIEKRLTAYFGGDVDDWTFAQDSDTSIKISRESRYCLVQRGHLHTTSGHSCIFINYNSDPLYAKSIVLSCFRHGSVECTEDFFAVFGWQMVKDSGTSEKEPNMFTVLSDEVWGYAEKHRLKRLNVGDPSAKGMVFGHSNGHPWVCTVAWDSYYDFVSDLFKSDKRLSAQKGLLDDLVNHLVKRNMDEFPRYTVSSRYVAFRDGVWDLKTLEFHDIGDDKPGDIVARHFFDVPFPRGSSSNSRIRPHGALPARRPGGLQGVSCLDRSVTVPRRAQQRRLRQLAGDAVPLGSGKHREVVSVEDCPKDVQLSGHRHHLRHAGGEVWIGRVVHQGGSFRDGHPVENVQGSGPDLVSKHGLGGERVGLKEGEGGGVERPLDSADDVGRERDSKLQGRSGGGRSPSSAHQLRQADCSARWGPFFAHNRERTGESFRQKRCAVPRARQGARQERV